MKPYWKEVTKVFEALSYVVKRCDDDGIDLYFTNDHRVETSKDTTPLIKILKNKKLADPGTATDIDLRLGAILLSYQERLDKASSTWGRFNPLKKKFRPMSIYVLTNGCWEAQCTGEYHIRNLIRKLLSRGYSKSQLGIQFISFGKDPRGLSTLEHLDSGLGEELYVQVLPNTLHTFKCMVYIYNFADSMTGTLSTPHPATKMSGRCSLARSTPLSTMIKGSRDKASSTRQHLNLMDNKNHIYNRFLLSGPY
jgi:hypothetical protein